jgi:hypothetical protein
MQGKSMKALELQASQKDRWRNIPITLKTPADGRTDGASLCYGLLTAAKDLDAHANDWNDWHIIRTKMSTTGTVSRYFVYLSIFPLVAGVSFFCGFLIHSRSANDQSVAEMLFGSAMLLAGVANSLAFLVFHRMHLAGYEVGIWRWPGKNFKLYAAYWRIARERGWSRWVLTGVVLSFGLALALLYCCAVVSRPLLK